MSDQKSMQAWAIRIPSSSGAMWRRLIGAVWCIDDAVLAAEGVNNLERCRRTGILVRGVSPPFPGAACCMPVVFATSVTFERAAETGL